MNYKYRKPYPIPTSNPDPPITEDTVKKRRGK